MLKPVSLSCGHSGCKECIDELVRVKGTRSKCPTCRVFFDGQSVQNNISLDQITRTLPVKCFNRDCGWEGMYENAADHYARCPKLDIECPNINCFLIEIREGMGAHATVCLMRKVPCPGCQMSVTWETLPDHQTVSCVNASIACPLSCGESFPRYFDFKTKNGIDLFFLLGKGSGRISWVTIKN